MRRPSDTIADLDAGKRTIGGLFAGVRGTSSGMKNWDTVAIVGVGLIGGSIGRDLVAQRLARRVIGIGRREESLKVARKAGACTETTTDLAAGVAEANLVIVCTPVGRIVDDVRAAAAAFAGGSKRGGGKKSGPLITDAGSTKGRIVNELSATPLPNNAVFVGSHPLAGSERSGPAASKEGLFIRRTVVVTPTDATPPGALGEIENFWKRLGARVVRMSPEEHDRALSATSHVPHVVAAALAGTTPEEYLTLTAGGWLDTTRIAAADGPLWRQILAHNRSRVVEGIGCVEQTLAAFRRAIEADDAAEVERLLEAGRRIREAASPPGKTGPGTTGRKNKRTAGAGKPGTAKGPVRRPGTAANNSAGQNSAKNSSGKPKSKRA